ncbi:hypothetical protein HHK36_009403 [Tetracentron sinense]|uniref:Uncharacterized protein n=1 Tax=Tetracentron sinense TaxID=13715 RepID=A0A835DI87_TETSI|nr:hypothetical protein HHK36_009403 [Tetracentron sinense]
MSSVVGLGTLVVFGNFTSFSRSRFTKLGSMSSSRLSSAMSGVTMCYRKPVKPAEPAEMNVVRVGNSVGHYDLNIFGAPVKILYSFSPEEVDEWIDLMKKIYGQKENVIGLQAKWYQKEGNFLISTLQLCAGLNCLIYHIFLSRSKARTMTLFLCSDNWTFTGVEISFIKAMLRDKFKLTVSDDISIPDTSVVMLGDEGLRKEALKVLAYKLLGCRFTKLGCRFMKPAEPAWMNVVRVGCGGGHYDLNIFGAPVKILPSSPSITAEVSGMLISSETVSLNSSRNIALMKGISTPANVQLSEHKNRAIVLAIDLDRNM